MRGVAFKEAIDIDAPEALGDGDVILLAELLLMEDQEPMGGEGRLQGVKPRGVQLT